MEEDTKDLDVKIVSKERKWWTDAVTTYEHNIFEREQALECDSIMLDYAKKKLEEINAKEDSTG